MDVSFSHYGACGQPQLTSDTVQGALNWLEETQDTPIDELKAAAAAPASAAQEEGGPSITPGAEGEAAKSLVCNECGKKFRNHDQASFHASKTSVGIFACRVVIS